MTVAADVIFADLKEPVRFVKEAKVRVFPSSEKFWNPAKPRIQEEFILQLKEVCSSLEIHHFICKNHFSDNETEVLC